MDNQLAIVDGNAVFTVEEQNALNQEIDRIIRAHKNNRQEINRLAFECTAALTEADDASSQLANKGFFRRLIGGITGSNKRLQDKINSNMRAAQYASQVTLQKLAEQNMMTFDLVTAINNKLNASIEATNEMFKNQFMMMGKFFLKNRRDIVNLEMRMNAVEKNVKLLNWQNAIEYLDYDGIEYSELDDASKIVCLTRDFYDITGGNWTTSDLLLLKAAMGQVGISPHQKVNFFATIKEIAENPNLKQKLLGKQELKTIDDPSYLISLGTLDKLDALENRENYVVNTTISCVKKIGVNMAPDTIKDQLVNEYMKQCAAVDLQCDIEAYDFLLDLLFNLSEAKSEKLLKPVGDSLSRLFVEDHSKEAFDTIREAAEQEDGKALYMLGKYYGGGYGIVPIDSKKAAECYKKSFEAGYAVAGYDYASRMPDSSEEKNKTIEEVKNEISVLADKGDFLAENVKGLMYDSGVGFPSSQTEAAKWYQRAAEQGYARGQCNLGFMYEYGQGVEQSYEKAVEWYRKAAEQGNARGQCHLGVMYEYGQGVEQSYEKAVEWYRKSAEQGEACGQYNLGSMYRYGKGVTRSIEKAREWYKKASDQGIEQAKKALASLKAAEEAAGSKVSSFTSPTSEIPHEENMGLIESIRKCFQEVNKRK